MSEKDEVYIPVSPRFVPKEDPVITYPYQEPQPQVPYVPLHGPRVPDKVSSHWSSVVFSVSVVLMICAAAHFGLCCYYLKDSEYVFFTGLVSDGLIFIASSLGVFAAKNPKAYTAKCYMVAAVIVAIYTVSFVALEMFVLSNESKSPASYLNGEVIKQIVGGLFAGLIVVVIFLVSCSCYVICASKLYTARKEAEISRRRLDSVTHYVMAQL
mmetsp:Transcript_29643/g.52902  ORF Transcript_29643/g.52902 Transcript_29643/m.52902 type:complete len:212 (+) Transcript_29643:3589-4224(+)